MSETEAESNLRQMTENKTGLSKSEEWQTVVRQIVENSHAL